MKGTDVTQSEPLFCILSFQKVMIGKSTFQMNWAFGVNENRMLTLVDCLVTHGFEKSV